MLQNDFSSSDSTAVKNVVIVGGGTSGWMCAAAIARIAPPDTSITLVESEDIGTIGVGEATIPTLFEFNEFLGIKENDLLRHCQGTFKLGIEFVDWFKSGERYFHPFGSYGRDTPEVAFHQLWLRLKTLYDNGQIRTASEPAISDFSLCTLAAEKGRFALPSLDGNTILSTMRHAYHFDSKLYGQLLSDYAEQRRVRRIEGTVVDVEQNPSNGFIQSITLSEGLVVTGDFFIDCTGFKSLLLGQTLGSEFIDWSHYLPCDRAMAMPSANIGDPDPFTRATADDAGWRWRIPLQHRTGNGHVYSSHFLEDEQARLRLMIGAEGQSLAEPLKLQFCTGHRRTFWQKNCVAIGLAGGFIEPLESTAIHLVQMGVQRLVNLWPGRGFNRAEIAHYNRAMTADYERILDFIVLHYKATEREDTDFWRYVKNMRIPDSLAEKLEMFRANGRIIPSPEDLFTPHSWLAVMLGQGIQPENYDSLVDRISPNILVDNLNILRQSIAKTADSLPSHKEYIARYCAAQPDYDKDAVV